MVKQEQAEKIEQGGAHAFVRIPFNNTYAILANPACRQVRNLMLAKLLEYEIECDISTRDHNGP